MPIDRQNRGMIFFYPFFLFLLLAGIPRAVPAHAQPQQALETKNILILHSHEANAPVFVETDHGLSTALRSGGIPASNHYFQSLDLRRNPGPEYRRLLVEEMRVRYGHHKLDMIVTMYPEALEFLLSEAWDIFPDIPILALYLPKGFQLPETECRIIGHSATPDVKGTLEIALRLVPGAKHAYVVSGTHEVDRRIEDQARCDFRRWEDRLNFRYLNRMDFEGVLTALSTVPPDTIVLLLIYSQDVSGRNYMARDLAQRLSQVSAAPIFGLLEVALGYGIAGGSLINFEGIGKKAGELALDILNGISPPENVPAALDVPPIPMFDWRQLRRWGLIESVLPKGSIIVNREFTLWDYRYYTIGALAFIAAQSFLLIGLLIQKRRRKSAENSLWTKTAELDQFFSVTLDLFCVANTEGYFLRLNPAWERVLGYSREELMANRFFDFVHPEDLHSTQGVFTEVASQKEIYAFENRYRCKDGTYRWLEWNSAAAGNRIYAAARDITERLNAEAEARKRRAELANMSRLTMIGKFTSTLAHEINQPLTAILSNAEAARRFLGGTAPDIIEVLKILDDIVRDDRRAVEVVQKVRALVKKEKPEHELLDLNKAIREVITLIRGEFLLRGLSVLMKLSPDVKMIRGDRLLLQQVMLNLIHNSETATRSSPRALRKIIVRTAMPDAGSVKASVTDFGTGIDQNISDRLFEPFCTTKSDGLGMGLFICKEIIKEHGGSMEALNNEDGGATFGFTLPAHQGDRS
jgi:PAS domain S-box-containing protein